MIRRRRLMELNIEEVSNYFCFTSRKDNSTVSIKKAKSSAPTISLEYSKDGTSWTTFAYDTPITVNANEKVYLKGINDRFATSLNYYNKFVTTGSFDVSGNIMSLLYTTKIGKRKVLKNDYTFFSLFRESNIVNAKDLILPATTLAKYCYQYMFWGCTSLTTAPELPATTLAYSCYYFMFNRCTSLTTAPKLPATRLVSYCYYGMFNGCTSLTTAPELPATRLVSYCYSGMFSECTSLNSITCLATNISAQTCTYYWVDKVASTGTFIKAASMSNWSTGKDGIPSGWTVQNAS